jgi:Calcineurin-like phosphoesterase
MPIYRFIGDCHGKFGAYKTILKSSPYPTIQVGDMGVGFLKWPHGDPSANPPYDYMVAGGHRFIRGNHDNPAVCKRHTQCIPDGTVIDNMMFIGGGLSIDRAYRMEGFSYWPDEEFSSEALNGLVDVFSTVRPEIMITHETPETIAEMIVNQHSGDRRIKLDPRFASRTRQAFQSMFEIHQPKIWLHGHWHMTFDRVVNGTRFICLPELATIDIDTDKVLVME